MQKMDKICQLFENVAGQKLDITQYAHRLLLQKIVYLLQELGINFEYPFNWYVKGPYCSQLANDIFEFFKKDHQTDKEINPIAAETKAGNTLKQTFGEAVKNEEEIELIGSLVFIRDQMQIKGKKSIEEKLLSLKPWYKKDIEKIREKLDLIENSKIFN